MIENKAEELGRHVGLECTAPLANQQVADSLSIENVQNRQICVRAEHGWNAVPAIPTPAIPTPAKPNGRRHGGILSEIRKVSSTEASSARAFQAACVDAAASSGMDYRVFRRHNSKCHRPKDIHACYCTLYLYYTRKGVGIRESLDTSDYEAALAIADRRVKEKIADAVLTSVSHTLQVSMESIHKPDSLCTSTVGAISEMLVCADLLSRGYEVFRSVSATCSCDIIAKDERRMFRVEVKTASPNSGIPKVNKELFDILAAVYEGEGIRYFPDLPVITGRIPA